MGYEERTESCNGSSTTGPGSEEDYLDEEQENGLREDEFCNDGKNGSAVAQRKFGRHLLQTIMEETTSPGINPGLEPPPPQPDAQSETGLISK